MSATILFMFFSRYCTYLHVPSECEAQPCGLHKQPAARLFQADAAQAARHSDPFFPTAVRQAVNNFWTTTTKIINIVMINIQHHLLALQNQPNP